MDSEYCSPHTGKKLVREGDFLITLDRAEKFPIKNGIPRFCEDSNYAESFGFQWHRFGQAQLDSVLKIKFSENRFMGTTGWDNAGIAAPNARVLEVGCGAGRFTEVCLSRLNVVLDSIDYSNSVEVNLENNKRFGQRLRIAQASIYKLPFPQDTFDNVFCLGVLQHTPDPQLTVSRLIEKTKLGGEIVVDFYNRKGWYTVVHAKYIFRPITKRLSAASLLRIINKNMNWMSKLANFLIRIRFGALTRFIPIVDVRTLPKELSIKQRREWLIMDTFDALSPCFDEPLSVEKVKRFFTENGCKVSHAGEVIFPGGKAAVVRAIRVS